MEKKQTTNMESIKKINSICKAVLKLTEEDFAAVETMADEQGAYSHPLKNATAKKFHDLSDHNTRVLLKLRELQETIK